MKPMYSLRRKGRLVPTVDPERFAEALEHGLSSKVAMLPRSIVIDNETWILTDNPLARVFNALSNAFAHTGDYLAAARRFIALTELWKDPIAYSAMLGDVPGPTEDEFFIPLALLTAAAKARLRTETVGDEIQFIFEDLEECYRKEVARDA